MYPMLLMCFMQLGVCWNTEVNMEDLKQQIGIVHDSLWQNSQELYSLSMLMDRLNTRNILKRKKHKLEGKNYNCVLCNQNVEETALHLFFTCPFSQACWQHLGVQWNLAVYFFHMLLQAKQGFSHPFSWKYLSSVLDKFGSKGTTLSLIEAALPSTSGSKVFLDEAKMQAVRFCDSKRSVFLSF